MKIFIWHRGNRGDGKERMRTSDHAVWSADSPRTCCNSQIWSVLKPGATNKELESSSQSPCGWQGIKYLSHLLCLSRFISRELNQKWSGQDSLWHINMAWSTLPQSWTRRWIFIWCEMSTISFWCMWILNFPNAFFCRDCLFLLCILGTFVENRRIASMCAFILGFPVLLH